MKEVIVIYWSATGNTKKMAEAVVQGAREAGASVQLKEVADATKEDILNADAVAFGCPAMGNEVLEEMEMEPYMASLTKEELKNKPCVLFGSYDWGDGQWMRDWVKRMKKKGANLLADGLIVYYSPNTEGVSRCKKLGTLLGTS